MIKEISEALAKIRFDRGESESVAVTHADLQLAHDLMRLDALPDADKAYENGYDDGRDEAYEDGYSDGKADGYDSGYEDGLAEGREQGSDD